MQVVLTKSVNFKTKNELRERIVGLLKNQKEDERFKKSFIIQKKLFMLREFKDAHVILFYASFDGEVDTLKMIKETQKLGKRIALPKINKRKKIFTPILVESVDEDLQIGPFGIKEPKETTGNALDINRLDMVVVPGLAFDSFNYRIGRGGGYFDRFLEILPKSIPSVGLAFDFQMVDSIPQRQKHDLPVSYVLFN